MAALDTLTDNFDDNGFSTTLWTRSNATQCLEQNQQLELSSILAGNYVAIDSVATYDLTGSSAFVQVVDPGNVAESGLSSWEAYPLVLAKDASNALTWLIGYSTIFAIKKVAGVATNLVTAAWDASVYKWVRTRESSGTVYFDYSTDGITWTNFTSLANPFTITAVTAEISVGTWQAEAVTSTMKVDNFNITNPGAKAGFSPLASRNS